VELGAEIARDYAGREPLLVGSLKACIPFICDLSRATQIHHGLDFIELAGYGNGDEDEARLQQADEQRLPALVIFGDLPAELAYTGGDLVGAEIDLADPRVGL